MNNVPIGRGVARRRDTVHRRSSVMSGALAFGEVLGKVRKVGVLVFCFISILPICIIGYCAV
mgnify:CR=1 FL=1